MASDIFEKPKLNQNKNSIIPINVPHVVTLIIHNSVMHTSVDRACVTVSSIKISNKMLIILFW